MDKILRASFARRVTSGNKEFGNTFSEIDLVSSLVPIRIQGINTNPTNSDIPLKTDQARRFQQCNMGDSLGNTVIAALKNENHPFVGQTLQVASSNAQDTFGGNGVAVIRIEGVDEEWGDVYEDVQLTGQTSATTFKKFIGVNSAYVITPTDTAKPFGNLGTIDIGTGANSSGSLANTYAVITPYESKNRDGMFFVPNGCALFITKIHIMLYTDSRNMAASAMWQLNHTKDFKRPENSQHALVSNVPTHQTTIEMVGSASSDKDNVIEFEEPYVIAGREVVFFDLRYINGSLKQAGVFIEGYYRKANSRAGNHIGETRGYMPVAVKEELKQYYKKNKTVRNKITKTRFKKKRRN